MYCLHLLGTMVYFLLKDGLEKGEVTNAVFISYWDHNFIQALLYLFNQEIAALKTVIKSFPGKCGNVCSPREVNFFYTLQKRRMKANLTHEVC